MDLNTFKSVLERDIDFLIVEELSVNREFQEWLVSRLFCEVIYKAPIGTYHSVSDKHGETDILFIFESLEQSRIAILIEDKIDASPQKDQGKRYKIRGEEGQKDGEWDSFVTCLMAPDNYLRIEQNTEFYEYVIAYEEIFAFFQSRQSLDLRYAHKAQVIYDAINKIRRRNHTKYDENLTAFVSEYYKFVSKTHSELKMQKARPRPAGSTWITFFPGTFNRHIDIIHQFNAGKVKILIFAEPEEFELIKEQYKTSVPKDAEIEFLKRSVSISFNIAKIDAFHSTFTANIEIVKDALSKIILLKSMVESIQ